MTQVQHELGLKQQTIENLEKQAEEQKGRLHLLESTRNQAFEKQLEFFEQQRVEYTTKIDRLQAESHEKDRKLGVDCHRLERERDEADRKMREAVDQHEQAAAERDALRERYDVAQKRLAEAEDELQQAQIMFGRDQALSQQSIEFLQTKLSQLQ